MKKSIVFMLINMNIGGTEKALLNMIAKLPKHKYNMTILLLEPIGGFLRMIPEHIQVEHMPGYELYKDVLNKPLHLLTWELIQTGKFIKALRMLIMYILIKLTNDRSVLYRYILSQYPPVLKNYDIAVAYAGPMDFISYFVANYIKAPKKMQWIHFDITKVGFSKTFAAKCYKRFDKIFVVSDEARDKLISVLPKIKEKTEVFHNLISPTAIIEQSKVSEGFNDSFDGVRILTVGRLTVEKGYDLAIRAFARLNNDGYHARWYCIGDGNCRDEYNKLIQDLGLTKSFILLGAKPNPYPYMQQCDIYVQPSRYEGYCITLLEAKCLNKPIVTTHVNGVSEQFVNEKTGLVIGINSLEIYNAVKKLIDNKELSEELSRNLSNETSDSNEGLNKFYQMC